MRLANNNGQASAAEYVITFFLVIAVISGMSTYVKRVMQARTRDALFYMKNTVRADYNGSFRYQYEPYYMLSNSIRTEDKEVIDSELGSLPLSGGIIQKDIIRDDVGASSHQIQLPPSAAD